MTKMIKKLQNQVLRKGRVRSRISGSSERPRLSVHVSNTHIRAQLVDDVKSKTLAYVSTVGSKVPDGNMTVKAEWVGQEIAKKAKALKIKQVVFDRGSKLYHGRVKALAEAARKEGLEF